MLGRRYEAIFSALHDARSPDPAWVLAAYNRFRVLCALQHGRRGVVAVNHQVELALAERGFAVRPGTWYPGRPVLITYNDYGLGLFNGDIGVCLHHPDSGELRVWFERAEGGLRSFAPSRLPECQTVYAMTIHKSQGSEFEEVAVLLPEEDGRILGRELLYTAVTRAKKKVLLLSGEELLRLTVSRSVERFGGLGDWLASEKISLAEGRGSG
jgi:exodeoxyribonuclease V alpha subunit